MSSRTGRRIAVTTEIWPTFQTIVRDSALRTGDRRPRLSLVLAELRRRGERRRAPRPAPTPRRGIELALDVEAVLLENLKRTGAIEYYRS